MPASPLSVTQKLILPRQTVIGIVAGEQSGDMLGGPLIEKLKTALPNVRFVGIGGRSMIRQGMVSLFPLEQLSVMGLVEVILHLPDLINIKNALMRSFISEKIDLFIGIDAPDFNLRVARSLKKRGVPSIQYVSPSVWAWREKRTEVIRQSVDRVLCLFPFEASFYNKHKIDAKFVGHPLAEEIGTLDKESLLKAYKLYEEVPSNTLRIALLPGSRKSEITRIAPELFKAASEYMELNPEAEITIPAINESCYRLIRDQLLLYPRLQHSAKILTDQGDGRVGRAVMVWSDIVVGASGTAMLEAMLLRKPAVVVYRIHPLTYLIAKRLIKIPWVSLPNILAGRMLYPELLQYQFNAAQVVNEIRRLEDPVFRQQQAGELATVASTLAASQAENIVNCVTSLLPVNEE